MSTRSILSKTAPSAIDHTGHWRSFGPLKRKFDSLVPSHSVVPYGYPSPPMSNPPSPPRQPPESSLSTVTSATTATPAAGSVSISFYPAPSVSTAPAYPFTQSYNPPQYGYPAPLPVQTQTWPGPPPPPPFSATYAPPMLSSSVPASVEAATARPSTSRPPRRSKTHVASACVNCKRAHLSCDVQRPCGRCVTSNKQVCFDQICTLVKLTETGLLRGCCA
jgi:hypothetical protein